MTSIHCLEELQRDHGDTRGGTRHAICHHDVVELVRTVLYSECERRLRYTVVYLSGENVRDHFDTLS